MSDTLSDKKTSYRENECIQINYNNNNKKYVVALAPP